jgi:hypothetical protein
MLENNHLVPMRFLIQRLVTPIENSKRNLTTDNWYTSIPLADYLLQKKITLTGTMKKKQARNTYRIFTR